MEHHVLRMKKWVWCFTRTIKGPSSAKILGRRTEGAKEAWVDCEHRRKWWACFISRGIHRQHQLTLAINWCFIVIVARKIGESSPLLFSSSPLFVGNVLLKKEPWKITHDAKAKLELAKPQSMQRACMRARACHVIMSYIYYGILVLYNSTIPSPAAARGVVQSNDWMDESRSGVSLYQARTIPAGSQVYARPSLHFAKMKGKVTWSRQKIHHGMVTGTGQLLFFFFFVTNLKVNVVGSLAWFLLHMVTDRVAHSTALTNRNVMGQAAAGSGWESDGKVFAGQDRTLTRLLLQWNHWNRMWWHLTHRSAWKIALHWYSWPK